MKMTLRAWRRAKGKTIAEMARWLDVHPNTYQKWEESPGKISIDKAIEITKGCNCSPSCYSCLRNYYNQKIHDLLNRKYAYDFLENYTGELESIAENEFDTESIL